MDKLLIRKCKISDTEQINWLRKQFPMGNGGALKYMKNVDIDELFGVFDDQSLVGVGRVSTQDEFYYYQERENKLYLTVKRDVAIASSSYLLPNYRNSIAVKLVRMMGDECKKRAPFSLFELRAVMPKGKNAFWDHHLEDRMGKFDYHNYIQECLDPGEEELVKKLPEKIDSVTTFGTPHRDSYFVWKFYEKKGYRKFGYSYSTGTPVIGKDFSCVH